MVLHVGKKAPTFLLRDRDGERHSLETFNAERIVLFFYPKDDTPGCTLEAKEFSSALPIFKRKGVAVVGISGGDNRSKAKFCIKHSLSVPLLSDSDFSVSESYGVYGEKMFMGKKYKGINRTTFVVNVKRGTIEHVFENVKPEGHATEVLEYLGDKTASRSKPSRAASPSRLDKKRAKVKAKIPARSSKKLSIKAKKKR